MLDHAGPAPAGESLLLSSPALKPGQVSQYSQKENFYLLGSSVDKFPMSKLPKHNVILRRFLAILRETQKSTKKAEQAAFFKEAARQTASEIKLVWKYHFGLRMICGKETVEDIIVDEAMKLIIMNNTIESRVLSLFKKWKELEKS